MRVSADDTAISTDELFGARAQLATAAPRTSAARGG